MAVKAGSVETISVLLMNNANVNVLDSARQSPFYLALKADSPQVNCTTTPGWCVSLTTDVIGPFSTEVIVDS